MTGRAGQRAATLALGAVAAAGVVAGGRILFATVMMATVLLLADLQALLRRLRSAAILPAAAIVALGVPLLADRGDWDSTPVLVLAGFVVAVLLVIVSDRRGGAVAALGATMLAGLLPGLGAGALVVLAGQAEGAPALLAGLVAGSELARAAAGHLLPSEAGGFRGQGLVATGLGAAVVALGLHLGADHGLAGEAVTLLAAVAVLAVLAAEVLRQALGAGADRVVGLAVRVAGSAAVAAPPALLVVRALG